jgi:hypothetical protein
MASRSVSSFRRCSLESSWPVLHPVDLALRRDDPVLGGAHVLQQRRLLVRDALAGGVQLVGGLLQALAVVRRRALHRVVESLGAAERGSEQDRRGQCAEGFGLSRALISAASPAGWPRVAGTATKSGVGLVVVDRDHLGDRAVPRRAPAPIAIPGGPGEPYHAFPAAPSRAYPWLSPQ